MDVFTIVEKWFWVLCIAATFANAAIFRRRAQRQIRANPELADGYAKLIRGFVVWGNIPWVVMGIGSLFGGVTSTAAFLRPGDGNPFVLAFFASVFLLWVAGTYWLFFRGGADMLVRHPGMLNGDFTSSRMLKIVWCLSMAAGIVAIIAMFAWGSPVSSSAALASLHASQSCRVFAVTEGSPMECRVAFDVSTAGYKSGKFAAFGLIFVCVGTGMVAVRKRLPTWRKEPKLTSAFTFFWLGFAVLCTTLAFVSTYSEYLSLNTAEREHRVETVEGIVTDFVPMPASGHALEHFCVSGTCFDYSDYSVQAGFNNTSSHGGPIREGLPVRVSHVGRFITRLEVAVDFPRGDSSRPDEGAE